MAKIEIMGEEMEDEYSESPAPASTEIGRNCRAERLRTPRFGTQNGMAIDDGLGYLDEEDAAETGLNYRRKI